MVAKKPAASPAKTGKSPRRKTVGAKAETVTQAPSEKAASPKPAAHKTATAKPRGKVATPAQRPAAPDGPAPKACTKPTAKPTTKSTAAPKTAAKPAARAKTATRAPKSRKAAEDFSILIVAQSGRLSYESLIFTASLRAHSPGFKGRLIIAELQPQNHWAGQDTLIPGPIRDQLVDLGAEVVPLVCRHFGPGYPHGNKIEAIGLLPPNQPFVFFDTDTLITGPLDKVPFDFNRPSASMRREGTWPVPPLYGPGYHEIWKSLYDRFGLDFDSSLDLSQPDEHWERYLYFNAGWFFGADPTVFGQRLSDWSRAIRHEPGDELAAQELIPWLDQITLPLVIHSLDGGRPGPELAGLDGDVTCHYRKLPLLYATAPETTLDALEQAVSPNPIKKLLRDWEPAKKLIYQGKGRTKIRPLFADAPLPAREAGIRKRIKNDGWWLV